MPTVPPTPNVSPMPIETSPPSPFTITSPSFADGSVIPRQYSCDGRDISPPLAWSGVPAGTKALLLTVLDPDARGFVHWVAWDLAPDLGSLTEGASGALPGDAMEGRNDFGSIGWRGPCPPSGSHRYVFTLTALSEPLGLRRGAELAAVQRQAEGATIGEARLEGTYRR